MSESLRAYSLVSIKAVDEDARTFSGTATTPTPDSDHDVVEPLGVAYQNPLPLLMFHDKERPVGHATFHEPTLAGIDFTASIPRIGEAGRLKDRVDEAWQSVKAGLIRGVSIRIHGKKDDVKKLPTGGLHWIKSRVSELSLVVFPSNLEATIQSVKSCDVPPAALGPGEGDPVKPSGAPDPYRVVRTIAKERSMAQTIKPIGDQIKEFEATRAAKVAERETIQNKAIEEGRSKDEAEKQKFDELTSEIKRIDSELVDLHEMDTSNKAAAKPVEATSDKKAAESRHGVIRIKDTLPPGIRYARYAMCVAASKGNASEAYEIAKRHYPDEQGIQEALKTAIGAGSTITAAWAGNLTHVQDWMGDFVDYLRPQTIVDKFGTNGIPSLRRAPFNTRIGVQDGGHTGYWVGEGLPTPVSKGSFTTITVPFAKVGGISVLTKEEVRFSNPSAEAKVRDDLARAIVQRMDIDFVDPAKAAVANVSPASITNGIVGIPASGTTATHVKADFTDAIQGMITANISMSSLVMITSSTIALQLSMMQNALAQPEFPDVTLTGGRFRGIPVIVSEHLTTLGSPGTGMIVFANASDVYLADDGNVTVEASGEASLEMSDAPTQSGLAGTGASLVSLWQNGLLGLKAEREVYWKRRRDAAVSYVTNVAYVAT